MQSKLSRDKLIILYVLDLSERELSNSVLSELILEMDDTNYFRLQEAINGLVESGLISMRQTPGTSLYKITPEGSRTLTYLKEEINQETLDRLSELMGEKAKPDEDGLYSPAEYYKTSGGSYEVRCRIAQNNISLVDLTMRAPSEDAAEAICLNWPGKSRKIYETIMEELI